MYDASEDILASRSASREYSPANWLNEWPSEEPSQSIPAPHGSQQSFATLTPDLANSSFPGTYTSPTASHLPDSGPSIEYPSSWNVASDYNHAGHTNFNFASLATNPYFLPHNVISPPPSDSMSSRSASPKPFPFSRPLPICAGVPFYDLPKEVHDLICWFLEPRDIVKWSSVCTTTWIYTMRLRNIWFQAMKKMCYINAVPVSYFPLLEDALAVHCYWAATMPDRLIHWMRKQPPGAFVHTRRPIDPRDPSKPIPAPTMKHVGLETYLVPGGRYLITDDGKEMSVSDLGMGSESKLMWVSTISHEHPKKFRVTTKPTIDVYRAPNGTDLRVIVFFDKHKHYYRIYHVHPQDPEVSDAVHLLGTHTEDPKTTLRTFRGDILITLDGNSLFLWNFVTDVSVTMAIHNDPPAKVLIASNSGHIILIHMHGFSTWPIPPFLYTSSNTAQGAIDLGATNIPAQFSLPVNFTEHMVSDTGARGSYNSPSFEKPPLWYEEFGSHPILFDLVRNRSGKEACQFRWRYELTIPSLQDTTAPTILCIARFIVPNGWLRMHMAGYCNDQILLTGMCDEGFGGVVCAPAVSPLVRPTVDNRCYSGLLFQKRRQMSSDEFSFDPVTGRVCYESAPYVINVLDYFHL